MKTSLSGTFTSGTLGVKSNSVFHLSSSTLHRTELGTDGLRSISAGTRPATAVEILLAWTVEVLAMGKA
jgi:hypothetical protein